MASLFALGAPRYVVSMVLDVSTLQERPDLRDERVSTGLPDFMSANPSGWDLASVRHLYPELQLVAQVDGRTVAAAQAVKSLDVV